MDIFCENENYPNFHENITNSWQYLSCSLSFCSDSWEPSNFYILGENNMDMKLTAGTSWMPISNMWNCFASSGILKTSWWKSKKLLSQVCISSLKYRGIFRNLSSIDDKAVCCKPLTIFEKNLNRRCMAES